MTRFLLCSVMALLAAAPAVAQEFPRWDVSGDAGWLSSNKADIAPDWDDWYDEATGGVALGRYWSPSLRTELRLGFGGEARVYQEERVVVPGEPFLSYRLREHHFRTQTAALTAHYQFFDNQWFHPHLGAGLEIERESAREASPPWQPPFRPPGGPPLVLPEVTTGTRSTWRARPLVTGGFKWYVNERGFVRSDLRVTFGLRSVGHVTWTAGIGVDL